MKPTFLFRFWFILLPALMLAHSSFSQIKTVNGKTISAAELNAFIQHEIDSLHIPSVTFSVINHGKIVYHNTLGYSDLENHTKANDQTIYEAASMSKSVFA